MSPVCDRCGGDINTNNHRHAGYCSPTCRTADQLDRARARRARQDSLRARSGSTAPWGGAA